MTIGEAERDMIEATCLLDMRASCVLVIQTVKFGFDMVDRAFSMPHHRDLRFGGHIRVSGLDEEREGFL